MNLYKVDCWIPFPASEYGGVSIVAAHDMNQVVEVCMEATRDWDMEDYKEGMEDRIREGCVVIGTTDLFEKPCIVYSFWT